MRERRAQIHTAHDLPNTRRRHSALDRRTPDAVYFDQANQELVA